MNVEELSMIGPNVDLETVNAINKKRLLAFVNHFVVNTTVFLNKLSKSCEHGLMSLENKIQKLETSVIMLESKLNSVPGLGSSEDVTVGPATAGENEKEAKGKVIESEVEADRNAKGDGNVGEIQTEAKESEDCERPQLDPSLMKYVKMLQFGVPPQAVKLKLEQENVDESVHSLLLNYGK